MRNRIKGFNDRLASFLGDKIATMAAFYVLVIWQVSWMLMAELNIPPFSHDKYPFVFGLFLSNLIQLWYLPLLQYTSKRQEKLLEEILLAQQLILEKLEADQERVLEDVETLVVETRHTQTEYLQEV